jgi:hypothetical protein
MPSGHPRGAFSIPSALPPRAQLHGSAEFIAPQDEAA